MEYGIDDDRVAVDFEENSIGKTSDKRSSKISVKNPVDQRLPANQIDAGIYATKEFRAQSVGLSLVPRCGVENILTGFGQQNQIMNHLRPLTDRLNCSHVIPEPGFLRNRAFRLSNSFFCHIGTGTFAGVLAMLSQRSATS